MIQLKVEGSWLHDESKATKERCLRISSKIGRADLLGEKFRSFRSHYVEKFFIYNLPPVIFHEYNLDRSWNWAKITAAIYVKNEAIRIKFA